MLGRKKSYNFPHQFHSIIRKIDFVISDSFSFSMLFPLCFTWQMIWQENKIRAFPIHCNVFRLQFSRLIYFLCDLILELFAWFHYLLFTCSVINHNKSFYKSAQIMTGWMSQYNPWIIFFDFFQKRTLLSGYLTDIIFFSSLNFENIKWTWYCTNYWRKYAQVPHFSLNNFHKSVIEIIHVKNPTFLFYLSFLLKSTAFLCTNYIVVHFLTKSFARNLLETTRSAQ